MNRPTDDASTLPRIRPEVLGPRLRSLVLALGADLLWVARRIPVLGAAGAAPALEVLGGSDRAGALERPEKGAPSAFLVELASGARPLFLRRGGIDTSMLRDEWIWLRGWPLPTDRWPTVFFVAAATLDRQATAVHDAVGLVGMEALARALAPASWIPQVGARTSRSVESGARSRRDPPDEPRALEELLAEYECSLLRRALIAADGNKSRAAQMLQISRQGLYRRLRRHGLMGATVEEEDPAH